MAQEFITIKIWRKTRQIAKVVAAQEDVSLANLIDIAISAYTYQIYDIQNLQILMAWHTGELESDTAAAFIGCGIDDLPHLWRAAVENGVRLIK